jgi:hypothetical protein
VPWAYNIREVVQKPHKPHVASHSFGALCKAAGSILIFWTDKSTIIDSDEYHFECSIHAAIQSNPVNTMIYPWVSALIPHHPRLEWRITPPSHSLKGFLALNGVTESSILPMWTQKIPMALHNVQKPYAACAQPLYWQ